MAENQNNPYEELHPSTVLMLDECDWMRNRPFPTSALVDDDSWIDEAELVGDSDIVPDSIIQRDLKAWHSLR